MASAIQRYVHFGSRESILGMAIEVGVIYCQTGNELLLVGRHGSMYDQTLAGGIGAIFAKN